MTTESKLKTLQKKFEETQSPEDEAKLLFERARVNDLAMDHLELAAYLGHGPAQKALDEPILDCPLDEWVSGLEMWGLEAVSRARVALSHALGDAGEPVDPIEDWIVCPCDGHRAALRNGDLGDSAGVAVQAAQQLAQSKGEDAARAAVQDELIGWLLGYGDPVHARVHERSSARQRAQSED